MNIVKYLALIFLSSFFNTASAALVSIDWKSEGDNLLTLDEATGRRWLDLSQTKNWSIDRAKADLPEFTIASTDSVRELFLNGGLTLSGVCNPFCQISDQILIASEIVNAFSGYTTGNGLEGFLLDNAGNNGYGLGAIAGLDIPSIAQVSLYPLWIPSSLSSGTGHAIWLFKDGNPQAYSFISSTPVPAPLPILGALAALGWSRKLRKRIKESQKQERS